MYENMRAAFAPAYNFVLILRMQQFYKEKAFEGQKICDF